MWYLVCREGTVDVGVGDPYPFLTHRVDLGFSRVSNFYKIRPIFKASNFYKIRA